MPTIDTEVNLVLNTMTEDILEELEESSSIPPNQVFFTDEDDGNAYMGLPVGSIFVSAMGIDDARYHLLDGSIILQNGVYSQFSAYLKQQVSKNAVGTCTQTEFDADVANTGNCGKFVIDDNAGTIRLPKITRFVQGITNMSDIGNSLEAGLPNITGSWGSAAPYYYTADGAINTTLNNSGHPAIVEEGHPSDQYGFTFDASRSSEIYGNSNTVQPQATQYPYYIVLANGYKKPVEIEIDNIVTSINRKLDYNQITDCILEAPSGLVTYSGYNLTIKQGVRFLIPNGRNSDGSLNNIDYTVPEDITLSTTTYTGYRYTVFNVSGSSLSTYVNYLGRLNSEPALQTGANQIYFNVKENVYYAHTTTTNVWSVKENAVFIGFLTTGSSAIDNFEAQPIISLASQYDVANKIDKVRNAVSNNIAGFGTDGKLVDLGFNKNSINSLSMLPSSTFSTGTITSSGTNLTAPCTGYIQVQWKNAAYTSYVAMANNTRNLYINAVCNAGNYPNLYLPTRTGDNIYITFGTTFSEGVSYRFVQAGGI